MDHSEQHSSEEQASAHAADASLGNILSEWQLAFRSLSVKYRANVQVLKSDVGLSIQALALALFCTVALVGVVLLVWSIVQIMLVLLAAKLGISWMWSGLFFIFLNVGIALLLKRTLYNALTAVNLNSSANAFFPPDSPEGE